LTAVVPTAFLPAGCKSETAEVAIAPEAMKLIGTVLMVDAGETI